MSSQQQQQQPQSSVQVKQEKQQGSQSPPSYTSFPLKACTQEDIEETRYHVLKFHSVKPVNPLKDFEEPSKLHRKDPKNLQFQLSIKELEEQKLKKAQLEIQKKEKRREYIRKRRIARGDDPLVVDAELSVQFNDPEIDQSFMDVDNEEFEKELENEGLTEDEIRQKEIVERKRREIKEAEEKRAAEMAIVAPDGGARKQKKTLLKRKTKEVKALDETKRRLRYEEFYPWVLEDYDAKNAWVGNYEASNNDNYVLLVLDNENKCFKMIPAEKSYRFTPRNKYATLTLEEAEAKMNDRNAPSQRWLMRKMEDEANRGERVDARYRSRLKVGSSSVNTGDNDHHSDDDEIDFDEEFQDDEEAPIVDGNDEENRESEKKMKREMLRSNNLLPVDENDDEFDDLFETRKIDKEGKKLRNALVKNAMNEVYDTSDEDEENPYISDNDLMTSDVEKEDEEIKVKQESREGTPSSLGEVKVKEENNAEVHRERKISVKSYNNGFVVFKATKEILSEFPKGQWNPHLRKRSPEPDFIDSSPKKIKITLKHEQSDNAFSSDGETITKEDIDKLLDNGPITLKVLLKSLKSKMENGENKIKLKKLLTDHFVYKVKDKTVSRRNH